jgi:hypothetical protein
MKIILNLLLLISFASFGQVFQTNQSPWRFRGLIGDSINKIPAANDTPYMVNPKWGENIDGALYLRKSDSTLWAKIGPRWVLMGGQNQLDSTQFEPVIDSTGNASFMVLYAQGNKIVGSANMTYDTANSQLIVTRISAVKGVVDTLYIGTPPDVVSNYDPATDADNLILLWDINTGKVKTAQWAGSGGGGDTTGLGDLYIRNTTTHENKRFNVQAGRLDSILAASSAGITMYGNSGTPVGLYGAGGGAGVTYYGGVNIDGTTRLNTGLTGILKATSGTVSTAVSGTDIKTINSTSILGSGDIAVAVVDSIAIRRHGFAANNLRSFNAGLLSAAAVGSSGATSDSTNIAIGYLSGRDVTTGYRNIFLGTFAGLTVTSGSENIGIGSASLSGATVTGSSNIAIGRNALQRITSGSNNYSFGDGSLQRITSGTNNVGIGLDVGTSVTTTERLQTGTNNVLIGNNSTVMSTGNLSGTAIGQSAKVSSYAVAIGQGAQNQNEYGVSIGYRTGVLGTGVANIRIGSGRNEDIQNVIAGSNNILIGSAAKLPDSTASNQITFYTNATSAGTNGMENGYNVFTRFSGGQFLFNNTGARVSTATASALLEVNGTTGGVLLPRLTASQRTGISSPASGLILTDTDSTHRPFVYNGSAWKGLAYTDQLPSIDTLTSTLLADVSMPSSGVWYSGPSVTLPVGTWMVMAHLSHTGGAANANVTIRLDGTTAAAQGFAAASRMVTIPTNALVNVASGTTTITLQAMCSTTSTSIAYQTSYQSQAGATRIIAVKIK